LGKTLYRNGVQNRRNGHGNAEMDYLYTSMLLSMLMLKSYFIIFIVIF